MKRRAGGKGSQMSETRVIFTDSADAVSRIEDGSTVIVNGFRMINAPEELFKAVEQRFLSTGHPRAMKLLFTGSVGGGEDGGINRFAHEGMISECYGAHYSIMRKLSPLILENKIKAYNMPQGVTIQLYRAMASHQPGILTQIGMGTFTDPDLGGGKLNSACDRDLAEKMRIDGKDYIFYRAPSDRIDWCMVRGTEADEDGNIGMSREALKCDTLNVAMAAKNNGGRVIVQVERIVPRGSIDPKSVILPRILVDYVCVCRDPERDHMQTEVTVFNEAFCSRKGGSDRPAAKVPMGARKVAARRAAMCLDERDLVLNFGVGVPDTAAMVLGEEGLTGKFIMTAESGFIGGRACGGGDFGAAECPEAIVDAANQFDMYQGGILDACFLGMAQCDSHGNINVSKFGGPLVTGSGGFIDISQSTKKCIFAATFFAKTGKYSYENGRMDIIEEGRGVKFVKDVEQITFSGEFARSEGRQQVWMVTERCVMKLERDGWVITEIAPGIDLERDVLAHMEFRPGISGELKLMDERLFREGPMGLRL